MRKLHVDSRFYYAAALIAIAVLCISSSVFAATTISTSITTGGTVDSLGGYKVNGNLIFNASTTLSNLALGYQALENAAPDGDGDFGDGNVAAGFGALQLSTTGYRNVAVGASAMPSNTTGNENAGVGYAVLQDNTTGRYNTGLGYSALTHNATGNFNVGIGYGAGNGTNGNSFTANTYIGAYSGFENTTGANYNTVIGYQAGYRMTTGSSNLILATATSTANNANLTTGSQNILIGNNISLPSATANGQLNIGNIIYGNGILGTGSTLSDGNIGIGTSVPLNTFVVSDGGAGGLEISPSLTIGGSTGVRFLSIDRADGDAIKDFYFYNTNGGTTFRADGKVGIGTTTPATRLHVTSGANATTTVTIGELGLATSKSCVNMNRSNGQPASFFINNSGVMVVSTTYCE